MNQPAYAVEAWHNGQRGAGPQCSSAGEFCFFCEFAETEECGHVGNLKAQIKLLVGQRKELSVIVAAVQAAYRENVRQDVEVRGPTGVPLVHPDWSRASISRHMLFSTEFPAIFENVVVQIHQSIIMQLNKTAIADGRVDRETTDELRKMVASLKRWQQPK
jgi:hypothetical protein